MGHGDGVAEKSGHPASVTGPLGASPGFPFPSCPFSLGRRVGPPSPSILGDGLCRPWMFCGRWHPLRDIDEKQYLYGIDHQKVPGRGVFRRLPGGATLVTTSLPALEAAHPRLRREQAPRPRRGTERHTSQTPSSNAPMYSSKSAPILPRGSRSVEVTTRVGNDAPPGSLGARRTVPEVIVSPTRARDVVPLPR